VLTLSATGVEFSAELHDLIHDDLARSYPTLVPLVTISLYDVAPRILSMFDSSLAEYASNHFARQGIHVHTRRTVTRIEEGTLHLKEEPPVKFGMLVWSTGLEMTPLIKHLEGVKKDKKAGRVMTDGHLRVLQPSEKEEGVQRVVNDVYAIGDCSVIEGDELPSTAQVASQKGNWLRKRLNLIAKRGLLAPNENSTKISVSTDHLAPLEREAVESDAEVAVGRGFRYHNILTLAYLGSWNAIAQRSEGHGIRGCVYNHRGYPSR
jgi:NADH dehydrogenase FAD-containing subunit